MSESESTAMPDQAESDSQANRSQLNREVARRAFAGEYNDATYTYQESDEDRAPRYALLPTGVAANRVFLVGTLTETRDVGNEPEYWQGRVVDPTGTFFVYAGEYQPEAAQVLRSVEPPAYVAVVGKPRTFEPDDGDDVMVSVRPESISVVDETERDQWVAETAERTLDRLDAFDPDGDVAAAKAVEEYDDLALEEYRAMVEMALTEDEDDAAGG